jgi:hypothetical protein
MAAVIETKTGPYRFDDRNIHWQKLGDLEDFLVSILDIDEKRDVVDFIVKFEPNKPIVLHRHLAATNTLVVQGEHRLYEPDGRLKEVRPVGSYTASPPGEPHRECGGEEGAVVFYSLRGDGGAFFDLLDDASNILATLGMNEFIEAFKAQKAAN